MPSAIVPCVAWVPKGKAQQHPTKVTLSPEEVKAMMMKHEEELEQVVRKEREEKMDDCEEEEVKESESDEDPELAQYGLDKYDDDEDDGGAEGGVAQVKLPGFMDGFMDSLIQAGADEYITLENEKGSDDEDEEIRATDSLLVLGKVDDEMSSLEVMVYNQEEGSEYVHHDQLLETFPLCAEWMDYPAHLTEQEQQQNCRGNLMATGGMMPCIDIWNLDVVDSLEPVVRLGSTKRSKKKKDQSSGHRDAVLDLSWNHQARHLLASASADCTTMLWDLRSCTPMQTLTAHSGKVQSVAWHPLEATTLLSGGMDKTVQLYDFRDSQIRVNSCKVSGEVETVLWNHFEPSSQFLVSCDDGFIYCFDLRKSTSERLYSLSAHSKAVNAISLSPQTPGALASVSSDKELKLWDIANAQPSCVLSRNMKMGELLSAAFCPDTPLTLAVGGQKQGVRILNLMENAGVRSHFSGRLGKSVQPVSAPSHDVEDAPMAMEESAASASASASVSFSASTRKAAASVKAKSKKGKKSKHKKR